MERIRFGKTGLMVSRVALGGIPIMRIPRVEAAKLVREAVDLGINFIDTATVYADSEEKIGAGIRGLRRDELVIASKSLAADRKTFNENLDLSLRRLGVEHIDIHQIHNISSEERLAAVFAPGGAYEGLMAAVEAGKVRFPGFSSHSLPLAAGILKGGAFASVQIPFNYIDHGAEKEVIPLAKELDVGCIAMKPMGGGLLDNAELSFRYLLQYDSIVPDPGIEKIGELREIAAIVDRMPALEAADRREIERLRAEFGPSWCHRCDYCQPCPQGIPISDVLSARSAGKRFSPERFRSMVGPAIEKARTCVSCGACATRCPYHLDIPALLKDGVAYWDGVA